MKKPVSSSDTNLAVQPKKMASGLKFRIKMEEGRTIHVAKTNALIINAPLF